MFPSKMTRKGFIAPARARTAAGKPASDSETMTGPKYSNTAVNSTGTPGKISGAHSRTRSSKPASEGAVSHGPARSAPAQYAAQGGNAPAMNASRTLTAAGKPPSDSNGGKGPTINGRNGQTSVSSSKINAARARASAGRPQADSQGNNGPIRAAKGGAVHATLGGKVSKILNTVTGADKKPGDTYNTSSGYQAPNADEPKAKRGGKVDHGEPDADDRKPAKRPMMPVKAMFGGGLGKSHMLKGRSGMGFAPTAGGMGLAQGASGMTTNMAKGGRMDKFSAFKAKAIGGKPQSRRRSESGR